MIMTCWISPDGSVFVLLCFEKRLHELRFGQQRWNIISLRHSRNFVTSRENKNITFYTEYSFQQFFLTIITTKTYTIYVLLILWLYGLWHSQTKIVVTIAMMIFKRASTRVLLESARRTKRRTADPTLDFGRDTPRRCSRWVRNNVWICSR